MNPVFRSAPGQRVTTAAVINSSMNTRAGTDTVVIRLITAILQLQQISIHEPRCGVSMPHVTAFVFTQYSLRT